MNDSIVEINELAKIIVHNAKYNAKLSKDILFDRRGKIILLGRKSTMMQHHSAVEYDVVDHCVNVAELIAEINNAHAKN